MTVALIESSWALNVLSHERRNYVTTTKGHWLGHCHLTKFAWEHALTFWCGPRSIFSKGRARKAEALVRAELSCSSGDGLYEKVTRGPKEVVAIFPEVLLTDQRVRGCCPGCCRSGASVLVLLLHVSPGRCLEEISSSRSACPVLPVDIWII